jgi:hypothetical protein
MNREQRLEMLGRLAEVPSVELKMNVPADQRLACPAWSWTPCGAGSGRSSSLIPRT